jgi:hypothetical protein
MLNSRTLDRRVILAGTAVLVWAVCAPMARSAGSPRAGASTWGFSGTATSAAAEPRCHFTFFLDEVDRVSQVEAIRTETDRKEPWRNSPRAVAQKSLAAIDSALASVELTEENSNSPVSERRFSLSTEQTRYDVTVVRPAATPGSGVDDESARWYVARILKLECPAGITVEEALAPDNRFFRVDLASGERIEQVRETVELEPNVDAHASAIGCPVFAVSYLSKTRFGNPTPSQKTKLLEEAQAVWAVIQEDAERSGFTVASVTSLGRESGPVVGASRERYEMIAARNPDGSWSFFAGFSADGRGKLLDQYCADFRRAR